MSSDNQVMLQAESEDCTGFLVHICDNFIHERAFSSILFVCMLHNMLYKNYKNDTFFFYK
jgi:hypothetical protein